jgi:cell division protein FtsQ
VDSRIAERRAEVRHERMVSRRRRSLTLVAVGALVALLAVVERSPLVALTAVEVAGNHSVSADEIRTAADLPLGSSTLRLRLGQAAERVEGIPEIRSATVRRIDPLTVRVEVAERSPIVVLRSGEQARLVDGEGDVLGGGSVPQLPVIAITSSLPEPGGTVADSVPAGAGFTVFRELPGPLRAAVVRYEVRAADDILLLLDGGAAVRFGRGDRVAEKARVLGALLEEVAPGEGWTIDVRAPNAPVVAGPGDG